MTPDRFEVLYERYSDGALSPADREEFLAALGTPEGRARFVDLSTYAAVVADEVRYMVVPGEDKPSSKRLPAVRVSPRRVRSRRSAPGAPLGVIFAIAAAVLVGFVALVASVSGGSKPPPATRKGETVVERKPPVVEPKPAIVREAPRAPEPVPSPRLELRDPEPFVTPPPKPLDSAKPPDPPAAPPEAPKPAVKPVEKETTVAVIAQVEVVVGKVSVPAGKGLRSGEGVETGPDGYALVRLGDGTKVELGAATSIARVAERSVQLERGLIAVEAAKQAPGKPLVFATPHAETSVLGTEFTLYVTSAFSRVDVREGRVKFTRLPGGANSVTVAAGHYAIAGAGREFAACPGYALWKAPAQGLLLWLRADLGVRQGPAGVFSWGDQAHQPVLGSQPALVPKAIAGKPALRFDGTDDFLQLQGGFNDFRQGLSAFIVARVASGSTWVRFLDFGQGPCANNIFFGRKDAATQLGFWVYAGGVTVGKVNGPGGIVPDQFQTASAVLGPQGRATLYKNGQEVASGQTSEPALAIRRPSTIAKSNYDPGDPFFKGEIAEVILFNRALGEAERAYVEGYLAAKYFDPTAPPALARPSEK